MPRVNGELGDLERVQAGAELEQQLGVETGADLAREHEVVALEVADQQRAEPDALSLRIGEAAHDQLLRGLALHLQPVRRAPLLVGRIAPLGDHPLPALAARALPGLGVVEALDTRWSGGSQRQALEQRGGARRARSDIRSWPSSHMMSNT